MGPAAGFEIDNWLRDGGLVLAATDRAARALQTAFHQRRRDEGLAAWPAPSILAWPAFIRSEFFNRSDGRMLLNPAQERALWTAIVATEQHLAALIEPSRLRLAELAMGAHDLLCSHAPRYLKESARAAWDNDSAAFSRWLSSFDAACSKNQVLSPSRAPLQLIEQLLSDATKRPPLLLAGFDRLLPVQREVLDAWGRWQQVPAATPATEIHYYAARDEQSELVACAAWSAQQLAANPHTRLLVITQQIAARRGQIERAFLCALAPSAGSLFEFSLGIPLAQVPLIRAASSLLRWLDGSLLENELDWLLSTGFTAATSAESLALQSHMRTLRRKGLARPDWSLTAFTAPRSSLDPLPASWLQRLTAARQRLTALKPRPQSPLDWAGLVPQLLELIGLPGDRRLSSAEFQAWQRFEQALDACASLGFDGRRINWSAFLSDLSRILDETLFAPESANAPIQITGPAESAGLIADAIWFLGATEDAWPTAGSRHPLIPFQVQREFAMPHSTPRADWDLAQLQTTRLLASAPAVHFSFARQSAGTAARPSRIITQAAGTPQPLPVELARSPFPEPLTEKFLDSSRIPFAQTSIRGGSSILTWQSQCAFKAFATARLDAQSWDPAEFGLTAQQRGQLLHAVLHSVWGGPPLGLRSLTDLLAISDRPSFVATHVQRAVREALPAEVRDRMPQRYLALEETRLTRLIAEWLDYEATRVPFTVEQTEATGTATIADLTFGLRLDRIDRLIDGSLLVIDYKTGDVSPKSWNLPRPDDVQLPLYAGFALGQEPAGLLFAKLRAGQSECVGRMTNATDTFKSDLSARSALAKDKLTPDQMRDWRKYLTQLARDFLAGRADVDPSEYPATCDQCGLHTICRVHENQALLALDEPDADEAADE
jgi:probable DNA repair protein